MYKGIFRARVLTLRARESTGRLRDGVLSFPLRLGLPVLRLLLLGGFDVRVLLHLGELLPLLGDLGEPEVGLRLLELGPAILGKEEVGGAGALGLAVVSLLLLALLALARGGVHGGNVGVLLLLVLLLAEVSLHLARVELLRRDVAPHVREAGG